MLPEGVTEMDVQLYFFSAADACARALLLSGTKQWGEKSRIALGRDLELHCQSVSPFC